MAVSSSPFLYVAGSGSVFPGLVIPISIAVFSSLHAARSLFPGLVRSRTSSSEVRLFPKIIPASPFPAISLKLDSRQTAAIRRRLEPVQAQRRCASEIDLTYYPHRFAEILALLQSLPDVRARCRQVERYGKELISPVPKPFVTAASRVEGLPASYNTIIHAQLDPSDPSLLCFCPYSNADHIRGLAAILAVGLSGSHVRTVADMSLAPFTLLIGQSLLPARWCNHFMLLLEHMQRKARELSMTNYVDYNNKVNDILSIMGLGSLYISVKDEIDKTHMVHELLGPIDLGMDYDGNDDNVPVDLERKKYDKYSDDADDDGLSWRVKRYPPMKMDMIIYSDGDDSITSTIPLRWG